MLAIRREALVVAGIIALTACGASDGTGPGGNAGCSSGSAITVGLGQVVTGLTGSTLCVAGGSSHQEYVVVPFYGTAVNTQTTSLTITGTGLDSLSGPPTPSLAPMPNLMPAPDNGGGAGADIVPDHSFDLRLRRLERQALASRFAAARQVATLRPNFTGVPGTVKVGDTISLNTNARVPCDTPIMHQARVAAITNKAIVLADLQNPATGFTDAQYQAIGTTFDTLVDPVDEGNFGQPTDIDANGHIVLFFTETVNELTPRGSKSYVGGFFFARDLFPITGTSSMQACKGSNYGEMFYLMVPDPTGTINGNAFSQAFVAQNTIGTTGHEFQHLINAARRLYVNTNASGFEEVWLNEGLSHVAEELLYYRESGYQPRQDLDAAHVRASAHLDTVFLNYEINNVARYHEFLTKAGDYGPYAENDSLATRGATWAMLRYLTDHHGSSDGTEWSQLVNSTTTGLDNLKNVYGADVLNQIRDWATSVYTDDKEGAATWQQPSWNFRSIMINALTYHAYPVKMEGLSPTAPLALSLVAGGSAYVQFATGAGKDGTLKITAAGGQAAPPEMQYSVVRIQ